MHQVEPAVSEALDGAKWLGPFGVDVRYPGDYPETLPGDEVRALELAQQVRSGVMAVLGPYLLNG